MFEYPEIEKFTPYLEITKVEPKEPYSLYLKFSNGEERLCDLTQYLTGPLFGQLTDKEIFNSVYINDFGTVAWLDGNVDLDQEALLDFGIPCKNGVPIEMRKTA
jgi:hypothetical protein